MPQQNRFGRLVALLGALLVAATTLIPHPAAESQQGPWCLICGEFGGQDFVTNVLLFVPLGVGLRLAGVPWRRGLAAVIATTLGIELLQIGFVSGRDASAGDLVANALGGALGMGIAASWRAWLRPAPRTARRLSVAAGVGWLAAQALASAAVQPSLPGATYWGQWSHDSRAPAGAARVLSVTLNARRLPIGSLPPDISPRELVRGPGIRLDAAVIPGASSHPPSLIAALAAVHGDFTGKVLTLTQRGSDAVLRVRTRSADARLRSPALVLARAFPPRSGDGVARRGSVAPVHVAGGIDRRTLRLRVADGPHRASRELRLRPALAWSLFAPSEVALARRTGVLTSLWVAALLVPVGYWAACGAGGADGSRGPSGGGRPWAGALPLVLTGALVAVGIGAVPALFGLAAAPASEWASAVAGVAVGWLLARRRRGAARSSRRPVAAAPAATGWVASGVPR
jgi:hypothetical protein